jgi:6-phosphogluconolactonase (cycloisomerase 2 family)
MTVTARLAGIGGLAVAATALFSASAFASTSAAQPSGAAVFVQTDNPSGNAIVAYNRSSGGTLDPAGTYPTGGLGGVLAGSVVDHLSSQGSLAYDPANGLLYAVNAGSNTVTVFAVHGDQLTRQQVISSGGTFPVSVAFHGDLVYVLNARGGGSVQGYQFTSGGLVLIPAWHRSLGLDPSLTPEFSHTPGQIGFTPDGSKIVVTTKANRSSIDVFTLGPSGVPVGPAMTTEPNAVPFGFTFDAQGHLVVTEAGPDAVATFTIRSDGTLADIGQTATGQSGTCWISSSGTLFYASNAGSASLSSYSSNGNGTLTALGNTPTDPGTVDSAISSDGGFLYAQTGAKGIVDEYHINPGGSLSAVGSVTVPGSAGGEGIAAS